MNADEYKMMPSTSAFQTAGRKRINDLIDYYKTSGEVKASQNANNEVHLKKFRSCKIFSKNQGKSQQNLSVIDCDGEGSTSESSDDETSIINPIVSPIEMKNAESEPSIVDSQPKSLIKHEKAEVKSENAAPMPIVPIRKTVYVPVNRLEEVVESRQRLPILSEEFAIMEAIMYNSVVVICGETGSGKTTQIPQFLYESGYTMDGKMVGITEPRRVAAISMAKRVGYELNMSSEHVSYQIRYEGNVTKDTKIKFMTDGVLLKEMQTDFLLRKYSALIIDEAHERSLYSDILIGFISRIIHSREKMGDPLKLIIMSATLRVEDFICNTKLFKTPPLVIKIESRQFPVTTYFNKYTKPNYLKEAFKKVCKIHATHPPGGILVFVTGRKEVEHLCNLLKNKYPYNKEDRSKSSVSSSPKSKNNLVVDSVDQQTDKGKVGVSGKPVSIDLDL